mmetsp:Transcript_32763/g.108286  ORF Transcript_32763/g.108286 Transcript_32763/m.108286 type:complete len:233 (+) Transcript_32763:341-1039(+)
MEAWVPTAPNPAAIAQSHQTQRIRVQERRLQVCTSGRKRPYYIRRATTDLSPGARLISRSRGHAHLMPGDGSPPFLVPQPLNAVERAYKRGGQVQRGSERVLIMKRGREGSSVTVQAANRPVEPALGRMGRIQPLNDALVHHERVANVHGDTGPLRDVEPSPAVDATPASLPPRLEPAAPRAGAVSDLDPRVRRHWLVRSPCRQLVPERRARARHPRVRHVKGPDRNRRQER